MTPLRTINLFNQTKSKISFIAVSCVLHPYFFDMAREISTDDKSKQEEERNDDKAKQEEESIEEDLTKIKMPKNTEEVQTEEENSQKTKDKQEEKEIPKGNETSEEKELKNKEELKKEKKEENIKKQQKLEEMKNFMESESETDEEIIFKNHLQEDLQFSIGNFNEYLDFKIQNDPPIIQLLVYCILFIMLFMPLPTLLLIFYAKDIKILKILNKEGEKTSEMVSFRVAFFIVSIYLITYITSYMLDNMITLIFSIAEFLDLPIQGILINILTVLKQSRYHLRNSIITYLIFKLFEYMKQEYEWFSKKTTLMHIFQTFIIWAGFLSLFLFIEKLIMNMLASMLREKSFENRILETNSKTFVYKKLIIISQTTNNTDKKLLIDSFSNQFDSGLFLKFSDLDYVSEKAAENIIESIFACFKVKTINYKLIKEIFPDNTNEVFYYLYGHYEEDYKDKEIDYDTLVGRYKQLMEDRLNVENSLKDRENIIGKLDFIFTVGLTILSLIFLLYLFNVDYKVYLAGVGPVFLGMSWLFTDTIKELYNCFVFHLINHIYDCGDRLVINSIELTVKEVDLLYTSFLNINNRVVYIPTRILINNQIENIRRSKEQFEVIDIDLEDTAYEKIIKFKENLEKKFAEDRFNKIFTGVIHIRNYEVKFGNIVLEVAVQHKSNFQSISDKYKRREEAINGIVEVLNSTGVSFNSNFICTG